MAAMRAEARSCRVDAMTQIVVGRYPLDTGAWFPPHSHPQPQILWSPRGVVGVAVDDQQWVLPPTRALWMPSGVVHSTGATRRALVTGIYLADGQASPGWTRPTVLAAGPLFAELIGYLGRDDLSRRRRGNAEAVLLDVLEPLPTAPLEVRIPADPRTAAVANALRADPSDRRGLAGSPNSPAPAPAP
jgi:quercetin dioxygenase-like cupin family protein